AAYEFGHRAHQLACLNAFRQPGGDSDDDGDFAFRLRGREEDDALPSLLLQVINKRAELAPIEVVCAVAEKLDALDVHGLREHGVKAARGGLHAHLVELATQALQLLREW